jgi:hypothetical protein
MHYFFNWLSTPFYNTFHPIWQFINRIINLTQCDLSTVVIYEEMMGA